MRAFLTVCFLGLSLFAVVLSPLSQSTWPHPNQDGNYVMLSVKFVGEKRFEWGPWVVYIGNFAEHCEFSGKWIKNMNKTKIIENYSCIAMSKAEAAVIQEEKWGHLKKSFP